MPFVLDRDSPRALNEFLIAHGWVGADRRITRLAPAGAGNMNLTLRAEFDDGTTMIVKQSRAFVERFPMIPAPEDRILTEAAFYRAVATDSVLAARMPRLLQVAESDRIACLEDLGPAADRSDAYANAPILPTELRTLLAWLARLHALPLVPAEWGARLANRAMRRLNHEHIFVLPLDETRAPDADAIALGLGAAARDVRRDARYVHAVTGLGSLYLHDGTCLLHGDYYPGSWLRCGEALRVIDPEFAFFGRPEFDVGVLVAHLIFSGWTFGDVAPEVHRLYAPPDGFSWSVAWGFAGVELMRRILGVAQLPLRADGARRVEWLSLSRELVLQATQP